jgi:hypothetical protein
MHPIQQVTPELMKNKMMRLLSAAMIIVGFAVSAVAKDAARAEAFKQTLTGVPALELPAKAAQLVTDAKAKDKEAVTAEVVTAAVKINPAAAPLVVGAISKAAPKMASIAAVTAATLEPKLTLAIAKAAAAAAPASAEKIVHALCKAMPAQYANIAVAVSQAAPASGNEILKGLASAIPSLQPAIDRAKASAGSDASIPKLINEVVKAADETPTTQFAQRPPPVIGPPFTSYGGTPGEVTPGDSGQVPPGGRNYAAP